MSSETPQSWEQIRSLMTTGAAGEDIENAHGNNVELCPQYFCRGRNYVRMIRI